MKLTEIYKLVDKIAPFSISQEYCEKYGAYDNSGILLDCGKEITCALFSLDCSMRAVEEAKMINAELIITHHPAIYTPLKELTADNPVTECAKAGISIISAHLNLDCAKGGIDDSLAEVLGAKKALRMHELTKGGYGSVFEIEKLPLDEFVNRAKETLKTERVLVYGDRPVQKIASFCGAGMDDETVAFALSKDVDTFVSSDPKHHLVAEAVEKGLNVILFTHYAAENYGFMQFYQKIKEKSPLARAEFFADERLM
ncbi:MAG: Nif3-like dinuclear metal center hexameric protein [Clostridia bacterium]|nr:Nif3-like dinuclear metal center hexameric protein [Clostridia bacterium]